MGHITRPAVVFLALWVSVSYAQNPLAKKPEPPRPFVGTFSGKNISLELSYEGVKTEYTGWLTFEGKRYSCVGSTKDGGLAGQFFVEGQAYDFDAKLQGNELTLNSGGSTYTLTKPGGNPLARGDGPQPKDQPAGNAAAGGVGIAFEPNAEDELVVARILPGSPAAKAGLKPGGVLREVGGKDVDELSQEQIRALIGGEPGTMVKLTIETDDEIQTVILQRADLSKLLPQQGAQPPAPAPGPGPAPNPGPTGFGPPPAMPGGQVPNAQAPAWMKPGVRITYWGGSASVASAGQVLVPDDKGNWVSKSTGQKYSIKDNPGAGGMGYQQTTISNIVGDTAVADFKQYLFNPEFKACSTVIVSGAIVSLAQGSETWIPPQKLAQMQEGESGGVRILRGPYPIGGKTYNALSINTATNSGGTRYTYDTETGLLLAFGSATAGAGSMTPGPHGHSGWAQGNTQLVQLLFMGVRQTNLPWTGQRAPQEITRLRQLDFAGTFTSAVQGAGQVSWPMAVRWDVSKIDQHSMVYRSTMRIDYGNTGLPNEPTVNDRAGSLMSVWIDPRALAQLRPGQVLDEDPITGMKTTVANVQGGSVVIAESGPMETSTAAYSQQTGEIQALSLQTQLGLGTNVAQVRRTR